MRIFRHTVLRLHCRHLHAVPVNGKSRRIQQASCSSIFFLHMNTDRLCVFAGQCIRHCIIFCSLHRLFTLPANQMLMGTAVTAFSAVIHRIVDHLAVRGGGIDGLIDFPRIAAFCTTGRCRLQHGCLFVFSGACRPCICLTERIGLCPAFLSIDTKIIGQNFGKRLILIINRTDLLSLCRILIVQCLSRI